jgi:hypothetical protein
MLIRIWRLVTLVLASLDMAMGFGHLLQLPARMRYDGALWRETQSMYRLFGPPVGSSIEGGAFLSTVGLAWLVRRRQPVFRWTLAGTLLFMVAQVAWWLLIAPVNAKMAGWTPDAMPADWERLRAQWEYTHAARAVLMLIGLAALLYSVLVETPTADSREIAPQLRELLRLK